MDEARRVEYVSRQGLSYTRQGAGPVVVLVHGWCLSRRIWMYLEHGLVESGHTVISPDLAGFGQSGSLAPRATLAEHADDVTDLLDELDVHGAVLTGFAFGAAVILSAPDYQRAGALVSLAVPSAATAPYARMRGSMLKDWPRFAARSAGAILSQPASDETQRWLAGIFGATSLSAALAGLDILEHFEPSELTRQWDVPAVFAHGADDPIVPPAVSQRCAEQFGGSYAEIPASGHLVVIDQKDAVLSLVADVAAQSRHRA
jgi:non-heme chloroperoxidase